MKIDNAQLAAFAAVLREGSFEAAARRLHVTPSAISQRIKLLEERLGQIMLQRISPCQPTSAGKALARFAGQLELLETDMLRELGVPDDPAGSHMRMPIVVNADSLDSWFLSVFDALPPAFSICFDIRVEDQDHSEALLREGCVMAAVSASASPVQGCAVEPLGIMRYLAVASPAHSRRYFAEGLGASTLGHAPMLAFNLKDGLQNRFIARFSDESLQPPTHYIPSVTSFVEAARRGLGWGMMPEFFVRDALSAAELVEIAPGHFLDVPLYWHRWRLDSPVLEALTIAVRCAAGKALGPVLG